jgi:hypothetical protein
MPDGDGRAIQRRPMALRTALLVGTGIDMLLLVYGLGVYPASRGATGEDLLLEALLIVLLFLYLYASLFGTREYDPVDRWIHRQGIVFGLAAGALWAGEVLNGSLGDTALFGSLRSVNFNLYRAIGQVLIASIPVLVLLAAGQAGRKTGQASAGVQVGLWSGLISGLIAMGILQLMTYLFMGALALSPANLSDYSASGEGNLLAFLVKNARIAGTAYLGIGLVFGAALGALGGLIGRTLARSKR